MAVSAPERRRGDRGQDLVLILQAAALLKKCSPRCLWRPFAL